MTPREASLYRRHFFEAYPGLRAWHERERRAWRAGAKETRTLAGRRRLGVERLTDRLNAPVQGTGADGLKLALALLWERRSECPEARPVLVAHDEVVVECPAGKSREARAWFEAAMVDGMDEIVNGAGGARVPVDVEVRVAESWGD